MATGKYLTIDANGRKIEEAGVSASAGAADATKVVLLDANGLLSATMMPAGIVADREDMPASEAVAAGDFVNVWDDAGTTKCRLADASAANAGKRAHGFVLAGAALGATATVIFEGTNTAVAGLTGGTTYYLSDTVPGGVTATPPSTSGYALQELGVAASATKLNFEVSTPIIRA